MSTVLTNRVAVRCDGPKCVGPTGEGPTTFSWVEQEIQGDATKLPDGAWRLLVLNDFQGNKVVFCKPECLRDHMRTYVPPLSPREKAEQDRRNLEVEAAKSVRNPDDNVVPIEVDATKLQPMPTMTPSMVPLGNEPTKE